MVQLKREVTEKYVFVKNGVIFKILKNNGGDECAVKLTSKNVPHITVNDQELYLDSLIEVGDVYSEDQSLVQHSPQCWQAKGSPYLKQVRIKSSSSPLKFRYSLK